MSLSNPLTVTITPYMERKERTDECGKCVMGGESRGNLHPLELQESDHQNLPVSTLCFLEQGSIGGAQALPLPPQVFSFLEGMERGAGPRPCFVCDWWGGGSSKNFRLLSDADPVRQAQWGCTLITYLIREEFKLCVLERGGVEGAKELPLETTSLNLG